MRIVLPFKKKALSLGVLASSSFDEKGSRGPGDTFIQEHVACTKLQDEPKQHLP
jgi:hypothetical protein